MRWAGVFRVTFVPKRFERQVEDRLLVKIDQFTECALVALQAARNQSSIYLT